MFFDEWASVSPAPVMAVAPAAAWPTKEWPEERTIELGKRLCATGWRVLLVCRAEERARLKEIGAWVSGEPSARWMTTDLLTVAAALGKARAAVVPDSGLMHLATAVGTPVVALFGPADPARTGPYGAGHRVVRVPPPCAPCHRRTCNQPRHACMEDITVEQVIAESQQLLEYGVRASPQRPAR